MDAKSLEVDIQLAVGKYYRHRGLEEAEQRLRRVLEIDPACIEAYLELGYRYYFRCDYERAIQELQKTVSIHPNDERVYATMGDALFALGREEDGIGAYEKALQIKSDSLQVLLAIGNVYLRRKEYNIALGYYQRALNTDPENMQAFIGRVWARYSPEGLNRVIEILQNETKRRPKNADIHYSLGTAFRRVGKIENAVAELRASISLDSRNAAVHSDLGSAYSQQGKKNEAVREWREALKLQPGHFAAHFNLASALASSGRIDEALQQCREALRIDPSFPQMHALMGSFCLHKQEYEQAQEALETALARNPDDQVSRWNLATCYRAQGKEDLAKKEMDRILLPCEEAVRELQSRKDAPIHDWMMKRLHSQTESSEAIQPKSYPEFLLTYSRICYTLKRYEESKHLCEEVLKVEPENKIAYLFLGNTCGRMELQDEAASAYRIALSIDPALSEARFNLAGILLSEGNIDQAKDEYLRLLSADPDFLLAYSNLAQIYMQAQSYDEAAGAWREVLRLDPSNENASINLSILDFQKACEAVAENYRQVRQLLQRITQELSRTWGMIPPVFLELDRVLVLINRSSWLLTVISEIKTDILHVNNVRMEFEGILQAMEGMLPAFISIELTELARLMKTFESSLVKLRESIKVLPDNMSEMKIDLWNENGKN